MAKLKTARIVTPDTAAALLMRGVVIVKNELKN